jgi:hypothetical protein
MYELIFERYDKTSTGSWWEPITSYWWPPFEVDGSNLFSSYFCRTTSRPSSKEDMEMLTSRFGEIRETRSSTLAFPGGRVNENSRQQVKRIKGSGVRGKQGVCTMSKGMELMSDVRHV